MNFACGCQPALESTDVSERLFALYVRIEDDAAARSRNSQAVEDRSAAIDLDRLQDMRMVTEDCVRASVDRGMSDDTLIVGERRAREVRDPNESTSARCRRANVRRECRRRALRDRRDR